MDEMVFCSERVKDSQEKQITLFHTIIFFIVLFSLLLYFLYCSIFLIATGIYIILFRDKYNDLTVSMFIFAQLEYREVIILLTIVTCC